MTTTPEQIDERQGLPSASSMARTMACPAWVGRSLIVQAHEIEKKWTADGTKIHAVLADEEDGEDLSDEQELAAGICRNKAEMLLVSLGFEEYETITETRLWITDDDGNRVASAKPDKVYIQGNRFAIFDYKTGRKDATPPAMNAQLVTCAIAVAQQYGITEGFLAIIPAWRQTPPVAEIGADQIAQWRTAIFEAITETKGASPRAKAGDHCDYCPVRPFCDEAWAVVTEVSQFNIDAIMQDSPEQIVSNWDKAIHAKGTIKAIEEQVKARLATAPDSIPGLSIGKGAEMKTIPGGIENYNRLTALYAPEVVLAAIKWTPAALAKVISPGKGTAATKKALEQELAELIETKPKAGSIERV